LNQKFPNVAWQKLRLLKGEKIYFGLRTTFTVKKTIEVTKRKENKTSNNLPKIYTNRLAYTSILNRNTPLLWVIVIKIINQKF